MKQRDVDRIAWAEAAAMVRDAELGEFFSEDFCEESGATDEQMRRAQLTIVSHLQKKAKDPS